MSRVYRGSRKLSRSINAAIIMEILMHESEAFCECLHSNRLDLTSATSIRAGAFALAQSRGLGTLELASRRCRPAESQRKAASPRST